MESIICLNMAEIILILAIGIIIGGAGVLIITSRISQRAPWY